MYDDESKKCVSCGILFNPYTYNPQFDSYGLMGNGYECWDECKKCREV